MDISERAVAILEEERSRFARDLHDGPVQVLANASMRLDMLSQVIAVDVNLASAEVRRLQRRLVQATTELRQLIYNLQPVAVDAMGIASALTGLAHATERDWKVPVAVHLEGKDPHLTASVEMMLYRAVQEALSNAAKHASAHHINITVCSDTETVSCQVSDDGKGFDPDQRPAGHYGLGNMTDRMALVGGSCSLDTAPGQGTRLTFRVPCG